MDLVNTLWVMIAALIVLDMQAGFLCLEAGAVRTKNAANVAIKNLSDISFVSLAFWAVGFALMHGPHSVEGLVGMGPIAPNLLSEDGGNTAAFLIFQMAFAATAATIVSGAVAERERFEGYILLSVLMGALIYPVAGHWVWGGTLEGSAQGWLAAIGFVDFAGATVVHAVGGWAALAAILVLGPRLGRFGPKKRNFEEHSVALSALGTVFLWIGWGAFNGGSALVFNQSVPVIIAHTMITAAAGGVTSILVSLTVYKFVRVDLIMNGVLAGLVAGTASVHLIDAQSALLVGAVGAAAMFLACEVLDALQLDDVVGAVPVHLAAGVAGTLLLPFVVPVDALPAQDRLAQFGIQLLGTVTVAAWVLGTILPIAYALRRLGLLRARPRDEVIGLNVSENRRHNAFLDLVQQMTRQARSADFSARVYVERSTETGALALRYNQVLDRVEEEISQRMAAMRREQDMRTMAEDAFEAMKSAQQESAWAACHDTLTGLGNRKLLDEISALPPEERDKESGLLVVAIDLDRFKDVNDTYGHEAGDIVLASVGKRLKEKVRGNRDFAFRIGGDEFVLLLEFHGTEAQAQWKCDALLDQLLVPSHFRSVELTVGASIGFALIEDGNQLADALKRADLALYEAKSKGRNQAVAYSATLGVAHDAKINLINDFKTSIANDEIVVELQPKVNAQTQKIAGVEVLARWEHPTRGRLSPDVFIPIAEELKMAADLDRHVLDLALEARAMLEKALGEAPQMSVNVSARRLSDPNLVKELETRDNLPKNGIAFEILETAYLDTITLDLEFTLNAIRALGIAIEVDDFGTGHASLASVLALKPDRLKIDRMFVPDVDKDPARRELMRGLIEMAARMSVDTVVEGVETMSEAATIAEIGGDILQGYAFSRPLKPEDFVTWAKDWQDRQAA